MKIAMLDPSLFTGRYDDSLCAALAKQGHEVRLLGRPLRATDAIVPRGYAYAPRYFRWSEGLRGLTGDGRLARLAKGAEYLWDAGFGSLRGLADADVVHVQWLPLPTADRRLIQRLAALRHRPALVHTVHNAKAYHGEDSVQARGYRALLDCFDRLIVHGEDSRQALIAQGIAPERLAIVPHPPMALAQADAATMAQVPDPQLPRLLFFGTIRPYKGFDLLIEACLKLWRDGLAFELAVAGKPFMDISPLLDAVQAEGYGERLILDLDFLKEEKLDAHLRKADMIVFPYRHIDSSGAFLSALHYGKAMACSRVGMFTDLPQVEGGDPVALCAPESVDAFAEALRPLVNNEAERTHLGRKALALQSLMANWDDAARGTIAAYQAARSEIDA